MKNISQKEWFSLTAKLNDKYNLDFLYSKFYQYIVGTNETSTEIIFYFDKKYQHEIEEIIIKNKLESFVVKKIKYDNWHKSYEQYFKPININDNLMIVPDWYNIENKSIEHIRIIPGMAFGTGTHETTQLVITNMIKYMKKNQTVLDLGSGSGILSIAALKQGASKVVAIEHDYDCEENFLNNMELNNITENYKLSFIDVLSMEDYNYDFILANINKNIILSLLPRIKKLNKNQSTIILSGLLIIDRDKIIHLIHKLSFTIIEEIQKGEWICIIIK